MFLGWTSYRDHDYYVRQYRDMKGSVDLDAMTPGGLAGYAEACGRTLARAHAPTGDAAAISCYLGSGTAFDEAITRFAGSYADQVTRDYEALAAAARDGRVPVAREHGQAAGEPGQAASGC